jgi:hypothetical protein
MESSLITMVSPDVVPLDDGLGDGDGVILALTDFRPCFGFGCFHASSRLA